MNSSEEGVLDYKWELVGINIETEERIAFPCSPNSVGSIINQIVNEDAEGLWETPDLVRNSLQGLIRAEVITIALVSKLAKVEEEKIRLFLNDSTYELRLPSDSVFMLMEMTKNLSSEQ